MEPTLSVDDFCLLECSGIEIVSSTKVRHTTTEGGLLSPVIRFLFGSWVETEITTTIRTLDTTPCLTDSLLEAELQQLLQGTSSQVKMLTCGYVDGQ